MLLGAIGLGFRHGIDWDHLAALADLTGYGETKRRRLWLATMYAFGHAAVVFALGITAIALGSSLPEGVDNVLERFVGATLVVLGVWVLVSLTRQGREFRLRSRWMLLTTGLARVVTRLRSAQVVIEYEHEHGHECGHAHHAEVRRAALSATSASSGRVSDSERPARCLSDDANSHRHRHVGVIRDPFAEPSAGVAMGIGGLHGVGAETPTQLVVLTAAAGAKGTGAGVVFLLAFIIGLIASNTTVAAAMAVGRIDPERSFLLYATLTVVIALFSVIAGCFFLFGAGGSLPAISG